MKLYNKKDDIFNLLLLIILPNMAVPFLGILTLVVLNLDNDINSLISTLITMFLSFVIIPYILIKKLYNINITYLGIKKLKPIEISFYIFIICIFEFYLLYKKYSFEPLLILSVQTTIVALTEEFWARGILFYLLKKILNKKWSIILVDALIFTFITHINEPFIDNLIYRLPGSILMAFVYSRKEKLIDSILIHFILNMIAYY